jgi:hypothetical protein
MLFRDWYNSLTFLHYSPFFSYLGRCHDFVSCFLFSETTNRKTKNKKAMRLLLLFYAPEENKIYLCFEIN